MKTKNFLLLLLALFAMAFSACQKDANLSTKTAITTTTSSTVASTGAIAISTSSIISLNAIATKPGNDSIYVIGCYAKHEKPDSVAFSSLPTTIGTYLTANYAGYTFTKAYKITDSTKVITGYVVIIKYNGNYIGLKFTSTGTFVSVLEQRDAADLCGKGWHSGGPFDNRDGKCQDTIALSAIPTAVKSYFTTTYPTDTLLHASITPDSTYILISKNKVLYATAITPAGKLVNRITIDNHTGGHSAIAQANLPAAILTYLTTTYPGYVFDKAFAETANTVVQNYTVFITSNSTKYAVNFTAAGAFVKAIVVR